MLLVLRPTQKIGNQIKLYILEILEAFHWDFIVLKQKAGQE